MSADFQNSINFFNNPSISISKTYHAFDCLISMACITTADENTCEVGYAENVAMAHNKSFPD
ncbi:MAG: hypothetical protein COA96_00240 [SAR86 cluster bacterium]|uniref:Uncharacterized protein n=1 Tax=SAR86 cluster bacterium TaxID=2030880 RepID=A0A2A5BBW4_9GAMM|nr:MAG: hypothetical protein COA96_00240 [SAR86 cluster bacterium]